MCWLRPPGEGRRVWPSSVGDEPGLLWSPEQELVQRRSSQFANWPYIVYSKKKKSDHLQP